MKKLLASVIIMCISTTSPVFGYNYSFESGVDTKATFGTPTQTDVTPKDPLSENIRRNKDVTSFPPSYGVFSGDIPTDKTSLYHDAVGKASAINTTNTSNKSVEQGINYAEIVETNGGLLPSTSLTTENTSSNVLSYYTDGSIGTLSIPKINLSVKVYEGETLDSMRKGVGHFEYTSFWDNNVGFAGHNRGSADYFKGVKNLSLGDTITYTTKNGTRNYKVFYKEKITDTDYSNLGWTNENTVTLITCVENQANLRWCVQAQEIK